MADETLDTLPADGSLPKTLGPHPDRELAYAWASANGGKIAVYDLTGPKDSRKATLVGYWVANAPIRNPYDGIFHHSTIPPQWREVDSKTAFDHISKGVVAKQPDWSWAPARPADKPNHL